MGSKQEIRRLIGFDVCLRYLPCYVDEQFPASISALHVIFPFLDYTIDLFFPDLPCDLGDRNWDRGHEHKTQRNRGW
jgi:hypothetical protein